jgi:hypothetical protein
MKKKRKVRISVSRIYFNVNYEEDQREYKGAVRVYVQNLLIKKNDFKLK